jgi:hypothetical protein
MIRKPPLPAPHGDKLRALLENTKLPAGDARHVRSAFKRYERWLADLSRLDGSDSAMVASAAELLSEYRLFLDLEVVFDSPDDFLYRQKGQLKLDNTVLEEFLPHLVTKSFGPRLSGFNLGPQCSYSAMFFASSLSTAQLGPSIRLRSKDQDFVIARRLHIKASFDREFGRGSDTVETSLGYLCAECKTNLDKTMFQEAIATAHDVKTAVPGAKFFLLCEWLDMTPISPAGTDIDEILVLRKARRIGSQVRSKFSTKSGRRAARADYERFLRARPFAADVFERLLAHIRELLEDRDPDERDVLAKGYY